MYLDQTTLGLIVFLAIMLHKAPTAFGLVTHLLRSSTSRRAIRYQLFLFSIAAPIGAISTFILLSLASGVRDEDTGYGSNAGDSNHNAVVAAADAAAAAAIGVAFWTGKVLLFSAGSFLYVATVHVLPDIYHDQETYASPGNEVSSSSSSSTDNHHHHHHHHQHHNQHQHPKKLSMAQIFMLIVGVYSPHFLMIEHSH